MKTGIISKLGMVAVPGLMAFLLFMNFSSHKTRPLPAADLVNASMPAVKMKVAITPVEPVAVAPVAALPLQEEIRVQSSPDDLVLNGIFISEQFKSAMINNHFYQEGDTIKGMKIVSIEYEQVKLNNKILRMELASIGDSNQE